jgi:hypothetical protein
MLHGKNPFSAILLKVLDIDQNNGKWRSGRFRDIYLNKDATEIILYTRNGGGNREHYDENEEGENCTCTGCTIQYHLPKHPNYLRDKDDDFDSTYAYIEFSVPEKYKEFVKEFMTGEEPVTIAEKFEKTMSELNVMSAEDIKKDDRFKSIAEIFGKIVDQK